MFKSDQSLQLSWWNSSPPTMRHHRQVILNPPLANRIQPFSTPSMSSNCMYLLLLACPPLLGISNPLSSWIIWQETCHPSTMGCSLPWWSLHKKWRWLSLFRLHVKRWFCWHCSWGGFAPVESGNCQFLRIITTIDTLTEVSVRVINIDYVLLICIMGHWWVIDCSLRRDYYSDLTLVAPLHHLFIQGRQMLGNCFPGNAQLLLTDGSTRRMDNVKVRAIHPYPGIQPSTHLCIALSGNLLNCKLYNRFTASNLSLSRTLAATLLVSLVCFRWHGRPVLVLPLPL